MVALTEVLVVCIKHTAWKAGPRNCFVVILKPSDTKIDRKTVIKLKHSANFRIRSIPFQNELA